MYAEIILMDKALTIFNSLKTIIFKFNCKCFIFNKIHLLGSLVNNLYLILIFNVQFHGNCIIKKEDNVIKTISYK